MPRSDPDVHAGPGPTSLVARILAAPPVLVQEGDRDLRQPRLNVAQLVPRQVEQAAAVAGVVALDLDGVEDDRAVLQARYRPRLGAAAVAELHPPPVRRHGVRVHAMPPF